MVSETNLDLPSLGFPVGSAHVLESDQRGPDSVSLFLRSPALPRSKCISCTSAMERRWGRDKAHTPPAPVPKEPLL